jgi:hypothetical protein
MEKKDREGQMFSLWPVLDTRLPKDAQVSSHPFFPTICADESQQFMTPKNKTTILLNLLKIGALHH